MEPEHGRRVTENTIQSNHDNGNPFLNLNNQINTNSELLQISPAPGDGNAPHVVSNQAETSTLTVSCFPKSPSSYGSPCGPDSSDDPSISLLPGPGGSGVQSGTIEPVSAADFSDEASPGSMISVSEDRGSGYLIQDSMLTDDVDWRNPNQSLFSSPPSQNVVDEDGYDPNRIPSSVFRTTTSPMDWSVTSNESLFSIYMGNSFSGYPGMFKSGELGRIEELSPQNPFEDNAIDGSNFSPNLPAFPETWPDDERQHSGKTEDDIRMSSKNLTDMTEESKENHGNEANCEENMAAPSKNLTNMTEESKGNHGNEANRGENMAASSKNLIDMTEESKENHGSETNREENIAAPSKNLKESKENHGCEANREENIVAPSQNLTAMTEESKENHGSEANREENIVAPSKNLTAMTEESKENHGSEANREENIAAPSKKLTDMTEQSKENHGSEANRENIAAPSKNLKESKENHGCEANREENIVAPSQNLTAMTEESKENHGSEANREENIVAPSKNLTAMTEESKENHGSEANREENIAAPSKKLTDMTEQSKENHGSEANRENIAASSKNLTDMTEQSKENHGSEANREENNIAASSKNLTDMTEESKETHGNEANREENIAASSKKLTDMTEESKENHGNEAFHEENMAAPLISAHKGELFPLERTNSPKRRHSTDSARSCSSDPRLSNGSASSKNRLSTESAKSCGSFAFPVLVTEFSKSDSSKSNSFRMRPDKKDEAQKIQQKQEQEPPKTDPGAIATERGCMSCFPSWLRCV